MVSPQLAAGPGAQHGQIPAGLGVAWFQAQGLDQFGLGPEFDSSKAD